MPCCMQVCLRTTYMSVVFGFVDEMNKNLLIFTNCEKQKYYCAWTMLTSVGTVPVIFHDTWRFKYSQPTQLSQAPVELKKAVVSPAVCPQGPPWVEAVAHRKSLRIGQVGHQGSCMNVTDTGLFRQQISSPGVVFMICLATFSPILFPPYHLYYLPYLVSFSFLFPASSNFAYLKTFPFPPFWFEKPREASSFPFEVL